MVSSGVTAVCVKKFESGSCERFYWFGSANVYQLLIDAYFGMIILAKFFAPFQ
jgi:hypothetical protein